MYTFLATFYNMDGGEDLKVSLSFYLSCVEKEDLNGMSEDQYAWIRACKLAIAHLQKDDNLKSYALGSIEFISC